MLSSDPLTLETLFIEKFLEKYKLNERDLKRAFSKFDKDNNGLLDLNELAIGISMFLNGVKDDDVRKLIAKYDLNNDGMISYDELLHLLTTRKATKKSSKPSKSNNNNDNNNRHNERKQVVVEPPSPKLSVFRSDIGSDIYSNNGVEDDDNNSKRLGSSQSDRFSMIAPSELESVIDYNNPRELEYRTKIALQSIHTVLIKRANTMRTHGSIPNRLTMTSNQLMEKLACGFLVESFKPYTIDASTGKRETGVTFGNFYDVLRTYVSPGNVPIRQEVAQFLFTLCQTSPDSNPPLTNPNELASLIFGTASSPKNGARLRRVTDNQPASPPKARKDTTFAAKVDQGRPSIARGPLKLAEDTYEINRSDGLVTVPLRFLSRKSRTALTAPSNFDVNLYKRSSTAPNLFFFREFVYGMSSTNQTSNQFCAIPATSPSNRSTGTTIVYTSAALGIVHDLANNSQQYFEGHDNDITCITTSSDGTLAATGSMGKKAVIHIWQTINPTTPKTTIKQFDRFIVALAFTFDARFLCGIGADDAHTMAIFDVSTGAMMCTTTAQHGLPPQIKSMCFSDAQQYTEHITKDHSGPCDVLVTAGEHHLRFWSFRRPTSVGTGPSTGASILYKGSFFGKIQVKAPKVYTSCGFIANQDKSFDIVTGGSNGIVYLWRQGNCAAFTQAIRGGVNCLQVVGDKVFCGGAKSVMKVLDGRTLETVFSYTLDLATISDSIGMTPRPKSISSKPFSPRPGSAISKQSDKTENAEANTDVTGITSIVVLEPTARGTKSIVPILLTTTKGMMMRINASASILSSHSVSSTADITSNIVFHYHTNDVWALATDRTGRLIATGGNDCNLFVWDSNTKSLISRVSTSSQVKCCAFDRTSSLIAIGTSGGSVTIYYIADIAKNEYKKSNCMKQLIETATRKDAREGFNDIKFSPNNESIAACSADNDIYVYSCQWDADRKQCILRQKAILRGHSSFVSHIDWSVDNKLLQSTCGAYELLCWDIEKGKQYTGLNIPDIKWKTNTCTLGFNVMGIWPPYSNGTDVKAIDVYKDNNGKGIVVVGTDNDHVQAFNYPCVVKNAPAIHQVGHSSFVTNVKFINRTKDDSPLRIVSVGGKDASVIQSSLIENSVKATYNYTTSL